MPDKEIQPVIYPVVDGEYKPKATEIIHDAKKEILFCTYKLFAPGGDKNKEISLLLAELISVHSQVPEIKILLNCNMPGKGVAKQNQDSAEHLKRYDIKPRYLPEGRISHAKILIIDSNKMIAGSHNWSTGSLTKNFEYSIYFENHSIIPFTRGLFLDVFEKAIPF